MGAKLFTIWVGWMIAAIAWESVFGQARHVADDVFNDSFDILFIYIGWRSGWLTFEPLPSLPTDGEG